MSDPTEALDRSKAIQSDPGSQPRIKYLALFDLMHMHHPDNPKDHDIGAIISSIVRFGFVNPPILDTARGRIVAGHGRVQALNDMKAHGYEPPERVRVASNDWHVPCIVGVDFQDEHEALAYLIADNRITELGGWNDADLMAALEKLNETPSGLEGTGYDTEDMDQILSYLDNPSLAEHDSDLVDIELLKPHPLNYKDHPEDQIQHLAQSIQEHGFYRKVVLANDNTILAGHGLVMAAGDLGLPRVPAVKLDLDPMSPEALRVLAGDNEINRLGLVNDRKLTELLKLIKGADQKGLEGTGFDPMMLANLAMVTRPTAEIQDHDAAAEWVGMPEYDEQGVKAYELMVRFHTEEDRKQFIEQSGFDRVLSPGSGTGLTTWWPSWERADDANMRFQAQED